MRCGFLNARGMERPVGRAVFIILLFLALLMACNGEPAVNGGMDLTDEAQLEPVNTNIALTASVTAEGVLLRWEETGDVPGDVYVLYRRLPESTDWGAALLREPLEQGHVYNYVDREGTAGQQYLYQVVALRRSGEFELREAASNIVPVIFPAASDG